MWDFRGGHTSKNVTITVSTPTKQPRVLWHEEVLYDRGDNFWPTIAFLLYGAASLAEELPPQHQQLRRLLFRCRPRP